MVQNKFSTTKHINQRNYLIDILKWVCMVFVIFQHVPAQGPTLQGPAYLHENFWIRFAVSTFLLLSGYTWSLSYGKHNVSNMNDMYKPSLLLKKFLRLAIPWFPIFILATIFNFTMYESWNWLNFFRYLILCGYGGGNYFLVIMFQLIILFPLIFYFVNKYSFKGFLGVYLFTVLFEIFRWSTSMPSSVYMYISIRYFAFVGFGAYLYKDKENKFSFKSWKIDIALCLSFAAGFVYIWFCFENPILQTNNFFINISDGGGWMLHNTFLGALYWLPILYILFKKVKVKTSWIAYMGKCSYSIFLIQMLICVSILFFSPPSNGDVTKNFYFLWFMITLGSFVGGWLYYLLFEKIIANKVAALIK